MIARNPRALAFFLLAAGGGLLLWYGESWHKLPTWSEGEIEQSVELNFALEQQRRGPALPLDGAKADRMREVLRAEIHGEIAAERRELERWMGLGAVLVVLGLGQLVFSLGFRKPG